MIRFLLTALALSTLVAGSPASADEAVIDEIRIVAAELEVAFENQDAAAIKSMTTSDHVAVTPYYRRAYPTDEVIATLGALDYDITAADPAVITVLGPETALVVQTKSFEGTFQGVPIPGRVYASALWVKQDGAWREKIYQETAIDE